MKSTQYAKPGEVTRNWVLIDAEGATLGRLATKAASFLPRVIRVSAGLVTPIEKSVSRTCPKGSSP